MKKYILSVLVLLFVATQSIAAGPPPFILPPAGGGGSMTYPGAGVANSTGSAWGTSYTVGTAANNLVQLDSSGKLPAVDGSALTGISGGVAGKVCKTITNPSDADNILFDIASARTITKISGIAVGGTSAVITLQDAGADGSGSTSIDDAITMDTDGANGGTISYAVHDGDIIKLDVGTVTGVVTQLMVCYE